MNKEEKRQLLLDYAQTVYDQENRFISKREIRKKFHIELYNYFNDIFDLYQHLGINVPLCFCPKEYAKKRIEEYVKEKSREGIYPFKNELEKDLKIHISTYYKDLEDLYKQSGIDYSLYQKRSREVENPFHPLEIIEQNKNRIKSHIIKNVEKGRYPSVPQIQEELALAFYKYFENVSDAYKYSDVEYDRPSPIILGKKKEKIMTKIVAILFSKMGFTIDRISIFDEKDFNKGEDIRILDASGNKILVELKAYHKKYRISMREINQLKKYMRLKKISLGFFVTTSDIANHKLDDIILISGNHLITLLITYRLAYYLPFVEWIREEFVNSVERKKAHDKKREEIIQYMVSCKIKPNCAQVEKKFRVSLKTYFDSPPYGTLLKLASTDSVRA